MRRRKVPTVIRSNTGRSRISDYNIRNDGMKDMKNHYGWSEQQLEQKVREDCRGESRQVIEEKYKQAYSQDKNQ